MAGRTIAYVDGFNVYYGMLKHGSLKKYKWTDLEKYVQMLRTDDTIEKIYYFTAKVEGTSRDRQREYIRALNTRKLIKVIYGKIKIRRKSHRISNHWTKPAIKYSIAQEKQTDVSIAVQMLADANHDRFDNLVLFSNDTDLVPALRMIRKETKGKKPIIVYIPSHDREVKRWPPDWKSVAHKVRWLPHIIYRLAQFPDPLVGKWGSISKPKEW